MEVRNEYFDWCGSELGYEGSNREGDRREDDLKRSEVEPRNRTIVAAMAVRSRKRFRKTRQIQRSGKETKKRHVLNAPIEFGPKKVRKRSNRRAGGGTEREWESVETILGSWHDLSYGPQRIPVLWLCEDVSNKMSLAQTRRLLSTVSTPSRQRNQGAWSSYMWNMRSHAGSLRKRTTCTLSLLSLNRVGNERFPNWTFTWANGLELNTLFGKALWHNKYLIEFESDMKIFSFKLKLDYISQEMHSYTCVWNRLSFAILSS